jgi:hypothetical protein
MSFSNCRRTFIHGKPSLHRTFQYCLTSHMKHCFQFRHISTKPFRRYSDIVPSLHQAHPFLDTFENADLLKSLPFDVHDRSIAQYTKLVHELKQHLHIWSAHKNRLATLNTVLQSEHHSRRAVYYARKEYRRSMEGLRERS